jgi:hypothetical protein
MYKFIIQDTKRKQNIFGVFLKYWPSSHNKLVIKAKMHAKTNIFWSFVVWKYDMVFFLIFERLSRVYENKIFFLFYNFLQYFDENGVF